MPSSPKIPKETILEAAFRVLIEDGYGAVNIKTVAKELGCSTQPISRHFGSMDGLREELLAYCLEWFKGFFVVRGDSAKDIVRVVAEGYVTLAYDCPNLYKYLYMTEHVGDKPGELIHMLCELRGKDYDRLIAMLVKEHDISEEAARDYIQSMNFYVHGTGANVVIGLLKASKEEVLERIEMAGEAFLAYATRGVCK